jgi:hypothetical protein
VLRIAVVGVVVVATALTTTPRTAALVSLIANADAYSVRHDRVLTVAAPGVLGNDVVVGGSSAVRDSQPAHGTLALQSNGGLTYTPAAGFVGTDTFRYHAQDLLSSNSATVTITVTNATPVAHDDAYTAKTGVQLSIPAPGVLGNDTDADGDTLTAQLVDGGGNGSLDVNADGSFSYKSGGSFSGDRSFTYRAGDGVAWSAVRTVTISVSPTSAPTPAPTPTPTPAPTPTPIPVPTLPIPSLPIPSLPIPVRPVPSLPGATLPPIPTPPSSARPTTTPAPAATIEPAQSDGSGGTVEAGGPAAGGTSGTGASGFGGSGPESAFTVDESFGSFDQLDPVALGGFEWAVPGLALSVPGLLLLLAVAAQGGVGLFSLPFVRRWLGNFGIWRRRAREARTG